MQSSTCILLRLRCWHEGRTSSPASVAVGEPPLLRSKPILRLPLLLVIMWATPRIIEPLCVEGGEPPVLPHYQQCQQYQPTVPTVPTNRANRSCLYCCLPQATVRIEPLSVEIGESPVLRSTVGVLGEVVK